MFQTKLVRCRKNFRYHMLAADMPHCLSYSFPVIFLQSPRNDCYYLLVAFVKRGITNKRIKTAAHHSQSSLPTHIGSQMTCIKATV